MRSGCVSVCTLDVLLALEVYFMAPVRHGGLLIAIGTVFAIAAHAQVPRPVGEQKRYPATEWQRLVEGDDARVAAGMSG
jgi:hypothetical protein